MLTKAQLSAQDCLFMGKHCFNSGSLARSLEWFEEAWIMAGKSLLIYGARLVNIILTLLHHNFVVVPKNEIFFFFWSTPYIRLGWRIFMREQFAFSPNFKYSE